MSREIFLSDTARLSIAELETSGANLKDLDPAIEALAKAQPLRRFRDHPLRGQLIGWRGCDVGKTADGVPVVMVYYINRSNTGVSVVAVAAHDDAYRSAREDRAKRVPSARRKKEKLKKI